MATVVTPVPSLIYLDAQGRARIQGLRTKVMQIAIDRRSGMDADAIHAAYPYLTLAQIHAALSYYYEHREEMDAQIERDEQEVEELRANNPNAITREELPRRSGRPE